MKILGEGIDQLVTLEMRRQGQHRDIVKRLYAEARALVSGPISYEIASRLIADVKKGDVVVLTTGAIDAVHLPFGETDGPPGLASLARALSRSLGALPVVVCEAAMIPAIRAAALACGLFPREGFAGTLAPHSLGILTFPTDIASATTASTKLLEDMRPKAIVSIERIGPSRTGAFFTSTGTPNDSEYAQLQPLFVQARERKILTVGVGDNGNEIGFGSIHDAVRRIKPNGEILADTTQVDVLSVANVSNWGAYGISAMLAAMTNNLEALHSPQIENEMITACVRAGAVDGATGIAEPYVDGLPTAAHMHIVGLLGEMIANTGRKRERAF